MEGHISAAFMHYAYADWTSQWWAGSIRRSWGQHWLSGTLPKYGRYIPTCRYRYVVEWTIAHCWRGWSIPYSIVDTSTHQGKLRPTWKHGWETYSSNGSHYQRATNVNHLPRQWISRVTGKAGIVLSTDEYRRLVSPRSDPEHYSFKIPPSSLSRLWQSFTDQRTAEACLCLHAHNYGFRITDRLFWGDTCNTSCCRNLSGSKPSSGT